MCGKYWIDEIVFQKKRKKIKATEKKKDHPTQDQIVVENKW